MGILSWSLPVEVQGRDRVGVPCPGPGQGVQGRAGWGYPLLVLTGRGWDRVGVPSPGPGLGQGRVGYIVLVLARGRAGMGQGVPWSWLGYPSPPPPPCRWTNKVKTLPSTVLRTWAVKTRLLRLSNVFKG